MLTEDEARGIVADLQGLTMFEAERALARAIAVDGALSAADRPRIRESKKVLVEGGGLLEFIPAPDGLEGLGGLERLKKWIATRRAGVLPDAGQTPLDPPKGILLLGVQGCGKSLAAKAVATTWGLPLLALDAGKLLAPYIGESERNLRDALRRIERMAPCVLWIDEIEKAFVSARTSESDGGVSKRLVATLLTWMQERASRVFLVATANSVEELPPEMMRKGRVDEVFFVDLPGRGRARPDLRHPPGTARRRLRPIRRRRARGGGRGLFGRGDRTGRRLGTLRGARGALPAGHQLDPGCPPVDPAALGRPRRTHRGPARLGLRPLRAGGLT